MSLFFFVCLFLFVCFLQYKVPVTFFTQIKGFAEKVVIFGSGSLNFILSLVKVHECFSKFKLPVPQTVFS